MVFSDPANLTFRFSDRFSSSCLYRRLSRHFFLPDLNPFLSVKAYLRFLLSSDLILTVIREFLSRGTLFFRPELFCRGSAAAPERVREPSVSAINYYQRYSLLMVFILMGFPFCAKEEVPFPSFS